VDGALAVYGQDPESGHEYQFVYRDGGAWFAELWRNRPEQTAYLWRALPTPIGMMACIRQAITERRQSA
jgi:hypothetical protein